MGQRRAWRSNRFKREFSIGVQEYLAEGSQVCERRTGAVDEGIRPQCATDALTTVWGCGRGDEED
jgi:hypothetical protein